MKRSYEATMSGGRMGHTSFRVPSPNHNPHTRGKRVACATQPIRSLTAQPNLARPRYRPPGARVPRPSIVRQSEHPHGSNHMNKTLSKPPLPTPKWDKPTSAMHRYGNAMHCKRMHWDISTCSHMRQPPGKRSPDNKKMANDHVWWWGFRNQPNSAKSSEGPPATS
jgi:hypothetical protein